MIEELPDDVDEIQPTRYSDLRNRHQFYGTNDNIDVPRTDGSEYRFKGEPIAEESVAHQSLDTLKQISSSIEAADVGGGLSLEVPKSVNNTPQSETRKKQNSIFSMFSGIRSSPSNFDERIFPTETKRDTHPPSPILAYNDENVFTQDAQRVSPEITRDNPMKKKPGISAPGISPRTGVRIEALNSLKEEAIRLGVPEDEVIHETRQAEIKKSIKRFTEQRDWNNHLSSLKNTYIEYSGKLSKPTNPHLIEYPSDTLLKAEIKKLRAVAKKQNVDLD
jgi:hypothetical protein